MPVNLDYETYNEFDIKRGMFGYAAHPALDILCFSYRIDGGQTKRWTPTHGPVHEAIPELAYRIRNGDTVKAWNAGFELLISQTQAARRIGFPALNVRQMRDTAARAASLALPRKMEICARVLRLRVQKDMEGSKIMKQLTSPHKPTKKEPWTRYTPDNSPGKFAALYSYCDTDVDTEAGVDDYLGPLSDYEQAIWELDFNINARGVPVDSAMAAHICALRDEYNARLYTECRALCNIDPSQVSALVAWINTECGFTMPIANDFGHVERKALPGLDMDNVDAAIKALTTSINTIESQRGNMALVPYSSLAAVVRGPLDSYYRVRRVLEIRSRTSQTSLKKFDTILSAKNADDRIRGMFLYWGAGPGRWAGKVVQLHNLKKPVIGLNVDKKGKKFPSLKGFDTSIELARSITSYDLRTLEMLFDNPMDALSSTIRPAIQAPEGEEFVVADYSSIEARIIAWLANEEWRLEVFNTHGKIYEASASKISGIPIEKIENPSKERQSGKVSELALGFGGSVGALIKMGAIDTYGLKYGELKPLVKAWRTQSPRIEAMWYEVMQCVISALEHNVVTTGYRCRFGREGDFFHIQLPSGRMLSYVYPRLETAVKVWSDEHSRFELFDPRRHPQTPHQRTRINEETGAPEVYIHEGYRPQKRTEFVFEGEDSKTRQWCKQRAWHGSIIENIVQGIAACLLRNGLLNTEYAGYKNVLHVHDEGGALVKKGWGDVKEYESLMCALPAWAFGLPMKAEGWRGDRYRK